MFADKDFAFLNQKFEEKHVSDIEGYKCIYGILVGFDEDNKGDFGLQQFRIKEVNKYGMWMEDPLYRHLKEEHLTPIRHLLKYFREKGQKCFNFGESVEGVKSDFKDIPDKDRGCFSEKQMLNGSSKHAGKAMHKIFDTSFKLFKNFSITLDVVEEILNKQSNKDVPKERMEALKLARWRNIPLLEELAIEMESF